MSKCPSKWNVGLTGRGGRRGSVRVDKGVKTMVVLTGPVSKGNMSHFKKGGKMVIQVSM